MKKYILPLLAVISLLAFKGGDTIKGYIAFKPSNGQQWLGTANAKERVGWFALTDYDLAGVTPVKVGEMPASLKFNPTTIIKDVDDASHDLADAFKKKTVFETVKIQLPAGRVVTKLFNGEKPDHLQTITFTTATIASLTTDGTKETMTLAYKQIVVDTQ